MRSSRISDRINAAAYEGRKALIPCLPAGFPDKTRFWEEVRALDANGADIIEIGVPFTDPMADGPIMEQAYADCLNQGVSLRWILEALEANRASIKAEIVLMGYLNPFLRYGFDSFASDAADARVGGVIIADMPLQESGNFRESLSDNGIDFICQVGLNTSPERLAHYAQIASGYIYLMSVLSPVNVRNEWIGKVEAQISQLKSQMALPLALGFDIASPDQLQPFDRGVDAVIFGSALISHIREGGDAASFMGRWRAN